MKELQIKVTLLYICVYIYIWNRFLNIRIELLDYLGHRGPTSSYVLLTDILTNIGSLEGNLAAFFEIKHAKIP